MSNRIEPERQNLWAALATVLSPTTSQQVPSLAEHSPRQVVCRPALASFGSVMPATAIR
jgi:hypothetical protein